MSIERLYRYRARVHRYPASIYDGDTFTPPCSVNLPVVDFGWTSTTDVGKIALV
jgi:hypothetical protein